MDTFVSKLFNERPSTWGLRGDPFLWAELSEYFSKVLFPCSKEAFQREFNDAFFLLTGNTLETTEPFFIPKYDQGGISSGMIDPAFWKQELLPLLIERLKQFNEKSKERDLG